jgi:hypothetical protein
MQETFIFLHDDLDSFRKYKRRKPLPSDRFLLDGILWKLANGLRWRDLAGKYPVRRCQELYSALYRSGRMQTVYRKLEWYLDVYGGSALGALVQGGCFVISGNHVLLARSEKLTWEKYTALLLLQQAYHARRSIRREEDCQRRLHGNYYRLPPLRVLGSPRRFTRTPSTPSSGPSQSQIPDQPDEYGHLKQNIEIRETESFGKGFTYGKIRRSKICYTVHP